MEKFEGIKEGENNYEKSINDEKSIIDEKSIYDEKYAQTIYKLNIRSIITCTIIFSIAGLILSGIKGLILGLVIMVFWVSATIILICSRKIGNERDNERTRE